MGDQALSTLLNMGFGYEESSAALEHCKKDVSEAVAYLTDPTRSVVAYGPHLENKGSQPMEIEPFEEEEEVFPAQGLCSYQCGFASNLDLLHIAHNAVLKLLNFRLFSLHFE